MHESGWNHGKSSSLKPLCAVSGTFCFFGCDIMNVPVRKPIRLHDYDYSRSGAYFVTVCTKNKQHLFWDNNDKYRPFGYDTDQSVGANCVRPHNRIHLSSIGIVVKNELQKISTLYNGEIKISKYVIMPDHIHMIIDIISPDIGRTQFAPTISRVIKQFKGSITKQIGFSPWQRSFNDHIIRNQAEYAAYWRYIESNPVNWENDGLF